ncbi:YoaK family protein [Mucilaginibacter mali]|uniref:YoaK family protein n=1 Tax=Mucilaginibacter mali TaxID=2740462 RepID=UPI001F18C17B|nr:YoaK family protein [Mucilaginibacter mali]
MTAGLVNAEGFLGFSVLTTNVTGHAALFAERIALQDWKTAQVIALWMCLFFSGAFFSSLVISLIGRNQRFSYLLPVMVEIVILTVTALTGHNYNGTLISKEFFAGSLLFAMGLQNALVTVVSGAAVRTTHLTGTFTDLGIELAQLFRTEAKEKSIVKQKIKLHFSIIFFFMAGAVSGAYLFQRFSFYCFFVPVIILIFALTYDILRIKAKQYYRAGLYSVKGTIKNTHH